MTQIDKSNYYKHIKSLYNSTDRSTINHNLRSILKHNNVKAKELHALLDDLSIHAIYSYYRKDIKQANTPELITLLIISEYLKIDITDFLK